ncbi:Uncharacterised protein [Vibrio cholerae]|nr:Uncharacterised protein [Vibrio cholerae]
MKAFCCYAEGLRFIHIAIGTTLQRDFVFKHNCAITFCHKFCDFIRDFLLIFRFYLICQFFF